MNVWNMNHDTWLNAMEDGERCNVYNMRNVRGEGLNDSERYDMRNIKGKGLNEC